MLMRVASIGVATSLLCVASISSSAALELRAEQRSMLMDILTIESTANVAEDRVACLTGATAKSLAEMQQGGVNDVPDVAEYCIAVLTRSARDGVRKLLRDANAIGATPASAVDTGFITAYREGKPALAGLPTMTTLLPIGRRCFSGNERNVRLCYATGYALGQRAYHGETITAR